MQYNYKEICQLNMTNTGELQLVRQMETGILAVKKVVDVGLYPMYQRLSQLKHRSLMRILEVELQDDSCVVMEEYISGETLEDILHKGKVFEENEVKEYLKMLCGAVRKLHDHGMIHRDITPGNIMLTTDGVLKLCDYDISRIYKEHQVRDTQVLGTHGYAAPEQFGYGQTDEQSDIYAMGVLVNAMLTGREDVLYKKKGQLRDIISTATSINPGQRYRSVRELEEELTFEPDAKDGNIKKFLRGIPGFRTWQLWKMIVALAVYPYLFFLDWYQFGESVKGPWTAFIYFVVPWVLFLDLFHVSKRVLCLEHGQKWFRVVIGLAIQLWGVY